MTDASDQAAQNKLEPERPITKPTDQLSNQPQPERRLLRRQIQESLHEKDD